MNKTTLGRQKQFHLNKAMVAMLMNKPKKLKLTGSESVYNLLDRK